MCCPSQRVGDLRESQGHFEMHFGGTSTGLTVHCVQYTESPCCTSSTIYLCDIQMPAECTLAGCTPRHIYIYNPSIRRALLARSPNHAVWCVPICAAGVWAGKTLELRCSDKCVSCGSSVFLPAACGCIQRSIWGGHRLVICL